MLNMATTVPLPATVVMMPAGRHLPDSVVAGVRDKEIPFGERTTGIQTTKTRQSAILNNTGNQCVLPPQGGLVGDQLGAGYVNSCLDCGLDRHLVHRDR